MGPTEARTPQAAPSASLAEPAPALDPPVPARPVPVAAVGATTAPPPAAPTPPSPPPTSQRDDPLARLARRSTATAVIRRTPDWDNGQRRDTSLNDFVTAVDGLVMEGASVALTRFNDLTSPDGYTARWKSTALRMIAGRDKLDGLRVRFGAARYGYAVESYVTQHLSTVASKLPTGFKYGTQIGKGSTRPDILVFDPEGRDVGWFDITSERSKGHIFKKFSTGWRTKPYVTELLYPNFDLSRLSPGTTSPEELEAARLRYQSAQQEMADFVAECRTDFTEHYTSLVSDLGKLVPSKVDQQRLSREALSELFEIDLPSPTETMNILRAFGFDPKAYGWKKGGSKNAGLTFLRDHFEVTRDEAPDDAPEDDEATEVTAEPMKE